MGHGLSDDLVLFFRDLALLPYFGGLTPSFDTTYVWCRCQLFFGSSWGDLIRSRGPWGRWLLWCRDDHIYTRSGTTLTELCPWTSSWIFEEQSDHPPTVALPRPAAPAKPQRRMFSLSRPAPTSSSGLVPPSKSTHVSRTLPLQDSFHDSLARSPRPSYIGSGRHLPHDPFLRIRALGVHST